MASEISGMDDRTGKLLVGWPYVIHSIEQILSLAYFERVLRPHVGSNAHKLIGELANQQTAQRFRWAVALAILLFVPNFVPRRIDWASVDRTGVTGWIIDGTYYPRRHKGDLTGGEFRSLSYSIDTRTLTTLAA